MLSRYYVLVTRKSGFSLILTLNDVIFSFIYLLKISGYYNFKINRLSDRFGIFFCHGVQEYQQGTQGVILGWYQHLMLLHSLLRYTFKASRYYNYKMNRFRWWLPYLFCTCRKAINEISTSRLSLLCNSNN